MWEHRVKLACLSNLNRFERRIYGGLPHLVISHRQAEAVVFGSHLQYGQEAEARCQ